MTLWARRWLERVTMSVATLSLAAGFVGIGSSPARAAGTDDPFLWLEDIDGARSMSWVAQHNELTARRLTARPEYAALHRDALDVLNSATRIPDVTLCGPWLYTLWQDRDHPRGIYRRTTLAEFRGEKVPWEDVLDLDALARNEGRPWAFGRVIWLPPDFRRCLIALAPEGSDAVELREFDPERRAIVTDGFRLPLAKSAVAWRDPDTLYVATNFGPGSLTDSGYSRVVKVWSRGTPLAAAKILHEGATSSVSVSARRFRTATGNIEVVVEGLTFWTRRMWQIIDGRLQPLGVPPTAQVAGALRGGLVLRLKASWSLGGATYPAGAVVWADLAALRGGEGAVELVVAPSASVVVKDAEVTGAGILVATLDNVRGRLSRLTREAGGWKAEPVEFPDHGAIDIGSVDEASGDALVKFQTFLTAPSLHRIAAAGGAPQLLKAQSPAFDGARFEVEQNWTTSADGTRVPYFVVAPKGRPRDGTAPVWMFSYGGFEIALTPAYSGSYEQLHGAYGKLWLERGGVFVLANIRGGGEFGPAWHTSVLKENHYKCFEDLEAVARDLVARKLTSPRHLGIEGRSNGGLLVAASMLRHPELYGAVVCGNPLADMQRYRRLLAGASWMAEYGDPDDPRQWAYLGLYSPYQNVRPGQKLPPVMFYTTTRDDRVHPGHARKLAAKMAAMGYAVDYYENTEGGHHGSVTNEQLATRLARTFAFLWERLR